MSDKLDRICNCGHLESLHTASPAGCLCCWCEKFVEVSVNTASRAPTISAATVFEEMAATYRERNALYGDNFRMVGPIMEILFPQGVPPKVLRSHQFHLVELKIVKLTRFAISNLTHLDSIHDDGVYSAMIEAILRNKEGS